MQHHISEVTAKTAWPAWCGYPNGEQLRSTAACHDRAHAHLVAVGVRELHLPPADLCQVDCLTTPESLLLVAVAQQVLQLCAHKGCTLAGLDVQELCEYKGSACTKAGLSTT